MLLCKIRGTQREHSSKPLKGLCNNYQEGGGGAGKLELSSKKLRQHPPPKQKKLVPNPLCYVKNNVAPAPLSWQQFYVMPPL